MNDKELLEMAAKAAGIVGRYDEVSACFIKLFGGTIYDGHFDPLNNDADAFRLMVQLGFLVEVIHSHGKVVVWDRDESRTHQYWGDSDHSETCEDEYAACRRAIVRAAAEIGRMMP